MKFPVYSVIYEVCRIKDSLYQPKPPGEPFKKIHSFHGETSDLMDGCASPVQRASSLKTKTNSKQIKVRFTATVTRAVRSRPR